ncbi:hypothetical protein GCM10010218_23150 [Streptomyces mashuensis]|uniref:DUF952 domain-containing protein n=1 Tax=Streptomyces mashuensis TaxID=33904 RepID=A0A919ED19_9ACTN|nr:DUF952 domain-containing protein [Streptomyces mashuensis]GHF41095.1 hypothetical protein GCM10010218_23150 [Streptomyces mashuensis]
MIFHLVPLDDWQAAPGRPYAPASLADEGFVHCSPDEETTLAVARAFYADVPGRLVVLCVDETALDVPVRFEAAAPAPPPGVAPDVLFPHVFGPVAREAVVGLLDVERDGEGRAVALTRRT